MSTESTLENQIAAYCGWLERDLDLAMSPAGPPPLGNDHPAEDWATPARSTVHDGVPSGWGRRSRRARVRRIAVASIAAAAAVIGVAVIVNRGDSTTPTISNTTSFPTDSASTPVTESAVATTEPPATAPRDLVTVDPNELPSILGPMHIPTVNGRVDLPDWDRGGSASLDIEAAKLCPTYTEFTDSAFGCASNLDHMTAFVRTRSIFEPDKTEETFDIVIVAPSGVHFRLLAADTADPACRLAPTEDPSLGDATAWSCAGYLDEGWWTIEATTTTGSYTTEIPNRTRSLRRTPYKIGDTVDDESFDVTWISLLRSVSTSGPETGCDERSPIIRDKIVIGFSPMTSPDCPGARVVYDESGAVIGLLQSDGPVLISDGGGVDGDQPTQTAITENLPVVSFVDENFNVDLDTYDNSTLSIDKKNSLIAGLAQVCVRLTRPDGGSGATCADSNSVRYMSGGTVSDDGATVTVTFAAATGTSIEIMDGAASGCDLRTYAPSGIGNIAIWACQAATGTNLPVRITPADGDPAEFILALPT